VRNITNFGVFVEIEPGIDGLVHISDLSWTKKVRHPGDMVDKGQDLDVVILNIDEDRRRISLGHKQVKTNPWDQFADAYEEGNDTTGEVVRVEEKGLVVQLPLDVEAFVPGSELENGPQNFENFYHSGDELELRVIRFDKDRKDIVLSETARMEDLEPDEIEEEEETETQEEPQQRQQQQRQQQPSRDRSTSQQDDETTGPTTLGELSGLADLRREMEEEEESDRAEAAEQAAQEAVEESDEAEDEEQETAQTDETAEDSSESESAEADEAVADEGEVFDETSGFPDNFPRVSRLQNAGVNSIAELREVDDLTELDGIGASYAEDIEEGLAEFDETGQVSA
jgi:small subunit ribosomal protein S1